MEGDNGTSSNVDKWSRCTFYDSLCYTNDLGLLVAASSLTHRYWTGKLIYIENYSFDEGRIDGHHCEASTDSSISNISYLGQSDRVLTAHDSGSVSMWQLVESKCSLNLLSSDEAHDDIVSSIDASLKQTQFVTGSHDCTIKVWNADECLPTATYTGHIDAVSCLSFSLVNDDVFLSGSLDKRIFLWDLRNTKPVSIVYTLPIVTPTSLAWVPGKEHQFISGTEAGEVLIMDTRSTSNPLRVIDLHTRALSKLAFQSSKLMLATSSHDATVALSLFSTTDNELKTMYKDSSHKDFVRDLAWKPHNDQVVSCSWDGTLKCHEAAQNRMEVL